MRNKNFFLGISFGAQGVNLNRLEDEAKALAKAFRSMKKVRRVSIQCQQG